MVDVSLTVLPPHARDAWSELAGALAVSEAPCERDPDVWFPGEHQLERVAAAVAACEGCPAREPCLRYALAAKERFGVWGGLTAAERQQLARAAA